MRNLELYFFAVGCKYLFQLVKRKCRERCAHSPAVPGKLALRGSGSDGLAAMQVFSQLGPHRLWRPLLDQPRSALHAYARQHELRWVDDPSNDSSAFDRNFLRQQVLPLLQQRWPQAAAALALSAQRSGQDSALLLQRDQQLLDQLVAAGSPPKRIDLPKICWIRAPFAIGCDGSAWAMSYQEYRSPSGAFGAPASLR